MKYPEKYRNDPTKRTPWISLEPGRIFIMGRSIPDNPRDFYGPVHRWITGYAGRHADTTHIDLGFEYINTTSTKCIFKMLKDLSESEDLPAKMNIRWYYEQGDDDMCELGFMLKSLIECPFRVIEVEEMNDNRYESILTLNPL